MYEEQPKSFENSKEHIPTPEEVKSEGVEFKGFEGLLNGPFSPAMACFIGLYSLVIRARNVTLVSAYVSDSFCKSQTPALCAVRPCS